MALAQDLHMGKILFVDAHEAFLVNSHDDSLFFFSIAILIIKNK